IGDVAPSALKEIRKAVRLPSPRAAKNRRAAEMRDELAPFDHLINQRELLSLSIDLILQPLALILLPALPKSISTRRQQFATIQYGITAHIRILAIRCFIGRIYVETSC